MLTVVRSSFVPNSGLNASDERSVISWPMRLLCAAGDSVGDARKYSCRASRRQWGRDLVGLRRLGPWMSCPRKREPIFSKENWVPAFAGTTASELLITTKRKIL